MIHLINDFYEVEKLHVILTWQHNKSKNELFISEIESFIIYYI